MTEQQERDILDAIFILSVALGKILDYRSPHQKTLEHAINYLGDQLKSQ